MNKLVRFLNLNKQERQLFIQAYVLLMFIRLGLFLLPFQRLKKISVRVSQIVKPVDSQIATRSIAQAINRSSRFCPGTVMCLAKALATNTLMNIYGFPCQLHIGVAKGQDNNLEAHAWVEAEGKVVVGYLPDLFRFKAMYSPGEHLLS
ncbi:MAG: lasso peptide biosynthesis B2 protein [Pleurocapsa sp. MO_192.B19]|nr:lasso peptide biosynthesis B2 protein [Pleurocapsa sp. MO_192.B19]